MYVAMLFNHASYHALAQLDQENYNFNEDSTDVFFAITRYLPNIPKAQSRSIYNNGWVTVGQIYGINGDAYSSITAMIDCEKDLLGCGDDRESNTATHHFSAGETFTFDLWSRNGVSSSTMVATHTADSYDDMVYVVDVLSVAPY